MIMWSHDRLIFIIMGIPLLQKVFISKRGPVDMTPSQELGYGYEPAQSIDINDDLHSRLDTEITFTFLLVISNANLPIPGKDE